MMVLYIPITIVLVNIDFFLIKFGQDPAATQHAQHYIKVFLPGLFFSGMADC